MAAEMTVVLAVAGPDEESVIAFLNELWAAGATDPQRGRPPLRGAPITGRAAVLDRKNVRFEVCAVGGDPSALAERILGDAPAVILLEGADKAANAQFRASLGARLKQLHRDDFGDLQRYVVPAGTPAFRCLDAVARNTVKRVQEAPTAQMDLRQLRALAKSTADDVGDQSYAATERVSLAEVMHFEKPTGRTATRRPKPGPRKQKRATRKKAKTKAGGRPSAKPKAKRAAAAKKRPAARKNKTTTRRPAPRRRPTPKTKHRR